MEVNTAYLCLQKRAALGVKSDYCLTQTPMGEVFQGEQESKLCSLTKASSESRQQTHLLSQYKHYKVYFIPCGLQKLTVRLLQQIHIQSFIVSSLSSVHQTQLSYFTQWKILTDFMIFVLPVRFKTCCYSFLDKRFLLVNIKFYSQQTVYQKRVVKLSLHCMLKKENEQVHNRKKKIVFSVVNNRPKAPDEFR